MDEINNTVNPPAKSGSAGSLVAILVILAVIIVGALYFWGQRGENTDLGTEQTVEAINMQGELDDTASIEADLQNTDVEGVDAELDTY